MKVGYYFLSSFSCLRHHFSKGLQVILDGIGNSSFVFLCTPFSTPILTDHLHLFS